MESMTEVTSEDLAGVYKEVAETVGVENAHALARKYGYSESRVRQILREAKDEIV